MFLETLKNLNLSFRELRGSFNEFKIVFASIFLGVFIISAVSSISENLKSEIKNKRAEMLGGNFELSTTYQEFPKNIKRWLEENGRTTHIIELRTMLSYNSQSQLKRRIVELKAVDNNYPLVGKVLISPNSEVKLSLGTKKNEKKILIDKSLKDQLGIDVGDFVYLGKSKFKINGIIEKEPDRMFSFATFGPRVLLSTEVLNETGLLKAGSLIKYKTKFIPNNGNKINLSFLNDLVKGTNVSVRSIENTTNNFNNFVDRTSVFISLVGLITLLISGVGISNGVKGYIIKKTKNIAIMKSLGAKNSKVLNIYLNQILMVFLISIIPAIILGISVPYFFSPIISQELFNTFEPSIFLQPISISFLYGLITCILFTILPLLKTYKIKPIELIRNSSENSLNETSYTIKGIIFILISILCVLTMNLINDKKLSFYILISMTGSFVFIYGLTNLKFYILSKIKFGLGTTFEYIRKSITKSNSFARSIVISFSIGLSLLITLNIIESSLDKRINVAINQQAPSHFLIDIQPQQIDKIKSTASNLLGDDNFNSQPMLRGRITEINNQLVQNLKVDKEVEWVLRRDRAFSWSNEIPKNTKLISGKWWPKDYDGPLFVSMGDKIAKGMNLKIGDKIKFNILGRNFEAQLFNTRKIIWENMDINFVFILSNSRIANAPHSFIATTKNVGQNLNNSFVEKIVSEFSNISSISIEESYKAIKSILNLLIIIINSIAFITLLSGIIVLSGIIDVGKKDKLYEVAILKILGATPRRVSYLWFKEYFIIGLISSFVSLIIGFLVAYILLNYVFNIEINFDYKMIFVLSLLVPFLITIFSLFRMIGLIMSKPLVVLRSYF